MQTQLKEKNVNCCETGKQTVIWKRKNEFCGPHIDSFAIIKHVHTRSPEFITINFCPFCGKKIDE